MMLLDLQLELLVLQSFPFYGQNVSGILKISS